MKTTHPPGSGISSRLSWIGEAFSSSWNHPAGGESSGGFQDGRPSRALGSAEGTHNENGASGTTSGGSNPSQAQTPPELRQLFSEMLFPGETPLKSNGPDFHPAHLGSQTGIPMSNTRMDTETSADQHRNPPVCFGPHEVTAGEPASLQGEEPATSANAPPDPQHPATRRPAKTKAISGTHHSSPG